MKIVIEPELPIGTEIWIMHKNKPLLGLIASYVVNVTSHTDKNESWYMQLWCRWMNKKQKDIYTYTFSYQAKFDTMVELFYLYKKSDCYYVVDRRVYFSKESLINNL